MGKYPGGLIYILKTFALFKTHETKFNEKTMQVAERSQMYKKTYFLKCKSIYKLKSLKKLVKKHPMRSINITCP